MRVNVKHWLEIAFCHLFVNLAHKQERKLNSSEKKILKSHRKLSKWVYSVTADGACVPGVCVFFVLNSWRRKKEKVGQCFLLFFCSTEIFSILSGCYMNLEADDKSVKDTVCARLGATKINSMIFNWTTGLEVEQLNKYSHSSIH